jgi:hypothetical protein
MHSPGPATNHHQEPPPTTLLLVPHLRPVPQPQPKPNRFMQLPLRRASYAMATTVAAAAVSGVESRRSDASVLLGVCVTPIGSACSMPVAWPRHAACPPKLAIVSPLRPSRGFWSTPRDLPRPPSVSTVTFPFLSTLHLYSPHSRRRPTTTTTTTRTTATTTLPALIKVTRTRGRLTWCCASSPTGSL